MPSSMCAAAGALTESQRKAVCCKHPPRTSNNIDNQHTDTAGQQLHSYAHTQLDGPLRKHAHLSLQPARLAPSRQLSQKPERRLLCAFTCLTLVHPYQRSSEPALVTPAALSRAATNRACAVNAPAALAAGAGAGCYAWEQGSIPPARICPGPTTHRAVGGSPAYAKPARVRTTGEVFLLNPCKRTASLGLHHIDDALLTRLAL